MDFSKIDLEEHQDIAKKILLEALQCNVSDRSEFHKLRNRVIKRNQGVVFHNLYFVKAYNDMVECGEILDNPMILSLIKKRSVRTMSGVAPVTVMTKAWPCPGKCVYCPTDVRMPKSYIPSQPAAARAFRQKFDPFKQMVVRLRALEATGHEVSKVELRVIGGTWSSYKESYQRWFLFRCLEVMNDWSKLQHEKRTKGQRKNMQDVLSVLDDGSLRGDESFEERFVSEEEYQQAVIINETAIVRCIGINIETRSDHIDCDEILRLRNYGVTKIEMGVQTTHDDVQELTMRGHDLADVRRATKLIKNAGFKLSYHMMPNLPGSDPLRDVEDYKRLFEGGEYQPDYLKIYPCMVMPKTILEKWHRKGEFETYSDEVLTDVLCSAKALVPEYVRIDRVLRDIPADDLVAGTTTSNMRQLLGDEMKKRGLECRCIRCREIGEFHSRVEDQEFKVVEYGASGGNEVFISLEDTVLDKLLGLVRLRLPADCARINTRIFADSLYNVLPEIRDCALVREVHVYGQQVAVGDRSGEYQHEGVGRRLMRLGEERAEKEGYRKIAVIAGIGTREYYRKLGYELEGAYMVKNL